MPARYQLGFRSIIASQTSLHFAGALTDRKWNRATVLPLRWRTGVETARLLVVGALALVSLFALAPGGLLVMEAR
jgi:hypothetical protein